MRDMETDLDRRERIDELEVANEVLRQNEQMLLTELDIAQRLQLVATQLSGARGREALYEQILDTALAIVHADFASIQELCAERGTNGELRFLGRRGLNAEAVKQWESVRSTTCAPCGEALRTRRRVAIPDVRNCDFMSGTADLEAYLTAGIVGVQTTPLVSRTGSLLGMVSTHWRTPHELSVSEIRALDILARLAADLIDRSRVEQALWESQQHLASVYDTVRDVIFQLAVEPEGEFRFVSVNAAFLKVTGLSREMVIGKTVSQVIPEPSLSMVLGKYRQAIEEHTTVVWEETSDYPIGRLTGEVSVVPVFDNRGACTHLVGSVHDITEPKRAEEERSHLAAIVESSDLAIVGQNLDGTIVSWNNGAENLIGCEREEVVGRHISMLFPPGLLDQIPPTLERLRRGEHIEAFETGRIRKDGQVVAISVKLSPIKDSAGAVVGVSAIARDITERKQAEVKLRESEERFRNMADSAPVMIWVIDTNKRATFFNKCCLDFTGHTMESKLGDGWVANLHPDDREQFLNVFSSSTDAREEFRSVFRLRRADGEYRWVLTTGVPHFAPGGVFSGYIGSCVDITDQKLIEDRLRASGERFRRYFELGLIGMAITSPTKGIVEVNDEICRILGYERADLLQKTWDAFTHPDDLAADIVSFNRVMAGEIDGYSMDKRWIRKDGKVTYTTISLKCLRGVDGSVQYFVVLLQDVTELRKAQEEALARQKLESLGVLANGIAHDFNNLLGGVLAQAELALTECATGSRPEEELRVIRNVAIRGSEIVRQLMIYAGKEGEALELVDVSQVVGDMIELLKVSVSKHARLELSLSEGLHAVWANAAQLRQIVMNLVTNASEAIANRDGVIRVTTGQVTLGPAIKQGLAEGDYLQMEVCDTGIGMSQETQARIFDPFFTTKSAGHGLGLAVVDGIVRGLRGAIHVTSEQGKGSTFQVLLPCAETTAGESPNAKSGAGESAGPSGEMIVLVVEDEDPLRQAVVKMLRKAGFEVVEAANGSAAIDLLHADGSKIDAMLLDITIPGASSHEVVAEAVQVRPEIKVILTSAYSQEMLTPPFTASQIFGFIRKPFQLNHLVQTLRSACPARRRNAFA